MVATMENFSSKSIMKLGYFASKFTLLTPFDMGMRYENQILIFPYKLKRKYQQKQFPIK